MIVYLLKSLENIENVHFEFLKEIKRDENLDVFETIVEKLKR